MTLPLHVLQRDADFGFGLGLVLVEGDAVGELDPDHIHTPSIFVKRIVEVGTAKKRIEFRNTRPRSEKNAPAAATGEEV